MYKCDFKNCLVNLSNSILKRFGVEPFHETIKEVDDLLTKKKKVVLFLFDGMGKNVLDNNPEECKDLRKHVFKEITSTFPPTTAAATNALLSGKYPNETGWLSWSLPFKDFNRNINLFTAEDSQTHELVPGFDYFKIAHYDDIIDLINANNKEHIATKISEVPIDPNGFSTIQESMERTKKALYATEEAFVYTYNTQPDHDCHMFGNVSNEVKSHLVSINEEVYKFAKENPDVLVLVIADHGHMNVNGVVLEDYPDFVATLDGHFGFEGRSANFKVKKGKEKQFEELFNKYFSKYFELYTTKEVFENELFGPAPMPEKFKGFFHDYLAVSISDKYFAETHELDFFKGHHAGGTKEELIIDLLAYNKD